MELTELKGFVPTPKEIVDNMVNRLFELGPPTADCKILDAGCGTGAFIEGIIRWCNKRKLPIPRITGIELDPRHIPKAKKLERYKSVKIIQKDFLLSEINPYDYIIGNPPYVSITKLSKEEKQRYRGSFKTARNRFDLYLLFFEQALRSLKSEGRLVFITPEKYLYVETANPLRKLLSLINVEEIELIREDSFGELLTYPTITTVMKRKNNDMPTKVRLRDGRKVMITFPSDGQSWLPYINGYKPGPESYTLAEISVRISCGVATGADAVFVKQNNTLEPELLPFAYDTIAGRELSPDLNELNSTRSILLPYDKKGQLRKQDEIKPLIGYLSRPENHNKLMKRTCVSRKPWFAFHETPPLSQMLKPKIICNDLTSEPSFCIDRTGNLVPQHSVYYIVPRDSSRIEEIAQYLNSSKIKKWLKEHCQHAANDYIRLQSKVLKNIPIPEKLVLESQSYKGGC